MKIYTRKGDRGTTSLIPGEKILKNDARLEAGGTADELLSYLGLIRDLTEESTTAESLLKIQKKLMSASSLIAAGKEISNIPLIREEDILFLEKEIDRMNAVIPPLKHFIIPGGDTLASHCHIARTLCRRAERRAVPLLKEYPYLDKTVQFLNRLSDYLFVLARYVMYRSNKNETHWLSGD